MQIEMIPIEDVREYERNPRINEPAVAAVAGSIREFGFRVPVIVDAENVLIAGHTRIKAARQLGLSEVPAVRAYDLTPEQIRAFRIADNKVHELSKWKRGVPYPRTMGSWAFERPRGLKPAARTGQSFHVST